MNFPVKTDKSMKPGEWRLDPAEKIICSNPPMTNQPEKPFYMMKGVCRNCGASNVISLEMGTSSKGLHRCKYCGMNEVKCVKHPYAK